MIDIVRPVPHHGGRGTTVHRCGSSRRRGDAERWRPVLTVGTNQYLVMPATQTWRTVKVCTLMAARASRSTDQSLHTQLGLPRYEHAAQWRANAKSHAVSPTMTGHHNAGEWTNLGLPLPENGWARLVEQKPTFWGPLTPPLTCPAYGVVLWPATCKKYPPRKGVEFKVIIVSYGHSFENGRNGGSMEPM